MLAHRVAGEGLEFGDEIGRAVFAVDGARQPGRMRAVSVVVQYLAHGTADPGYLGPG
jgi:hypothetical protein